MNHMDAYVNLGNQATAFGLGLLASKKMRPYAKYIIIGGLAIAAVPSMMQLAERKKLKQLEFEEQVEEVLLGCEQEPCCDEDAVECEDAEECAEAALVADQDATEADDCLEEQPECSETEETPEV